jgi:hypothetical protein
MVLLLAPRKRGLFLLRRRASIWIAQERMAAGARSAGRQQAQALAQPRPTRNQCQQYTEPSAKSGVPNSG